MHRRWPTVAEAKAGAFQSVLSARSFCLRDSGAVAPSAPAKARKGEGGPLPRVHSDRAAMTQGGAGVNCSLALAA